MQGFQSESVRPLFKRTQEFPSNAAARHVGTDIQARNLSADLIKFTEAYDRAIFFGDEELVTADSLSIIFRAQTLRPYSNYFLRVMTGTRFPDSFGMNAPNRFFIFLFGFANGEHLSSSNHAFGSVDL